MAANPAHQKEVRAARTYAVSHHKGERHGDLAYAAYLDEIAGILVELGYTDPIWLAAAYLHDVLRGRATTREDVTAHFGEQVAKLVWVTPEEEGPVGGPSTRAASYANQMSRVPGALAIRVAVRLADVRHGGNLFGLDRREDACSALESTLRQHLKAS